MDAAAQEKSSALIAQADLHLRQGDYRKVLEIGLEIIALQPDRAQGFLYSAQGYLGLDQEAEAEVTVREALTRDPESAFAQRLLAAALRTRKKFKPAEEAIQASLRLDPLDPAAWCELAQLCYAQEDLGGTRRYAQKALELDPENVPALNLLGMGTSSETPGDVRRQIETYQRALEADPEDPYVHNNLGAAYHEMGDHASAERCFRQALMINPREKLFRSNLYLVLKQRSILYRLLSAPGDFLLKAVSFVANHWWTFFLILVIPAFFLRVSPLLILWLPAMAFVAWFIVFKPLIKLYEFLTISDIKAQALEVGARRGGLMGIHGWPFWARFLILFLAMCGVWTAIGSAVAHPITRPFVIGTLIAGVVVFWAWGWIVQRRENPRQQGASRRRQMFRHMERGR